MTDRKSEKTEPEEIKAEDLDQATGGYGHRMYYSYESTAAPSYQAKSDDSPSNS